MTIRMKSSRTSTLSKSKQVERPIPARESHRIAVVGDWVVDEYWHLVRHHSDISSHTGISYYRSSVKEGAVFMDLCGAGHVARALYDLQQRVPLHRFELFGLGVWHPDDETLLQHLLHGRGDCPVASAYFRITREFCGEVPSVRLLNLDRSSGRTTRVVRLYHATEAGLKQLSRIDWEHPQPEGPEKLLVLPKDLPNQIDAVVVNDLRKGAVNDALINRLLRDFPSACWYVRTKKLDLPWLQRLGKRLKLLLIGPEILALRNPWGDWLLHNQVSREARDLLGEVSSACSRVVLVSEDREIIQLVDRKRCITTKVMNDIDPISRVGWPNAFFASLVFELRRGGEESELIENAIQSADDDGLSRITSPSRPAPVAKPVILSLDWEEEKEKWKSALSGKGVIEDKNQGPCLEVWRGCTALPSYVSCIQEKTRVVDEIGKLLRAFSNTATPRRSVNILIQADPGAGKTFLARSLARAFDFSLIRRDITQMVNRESLLELFDSVATEQANQDKPILVFVDEVNAHLESSSVFGAFLSPLEEGSYVRFGKLFNLRPCVWIFAGTDIENDRSDRKDKVDDFRSRMTLIAQIDFESLRQKRPDASLIDEARLEQVYLGTAMIQHFYQDVDQISEGVLRKFYDLKPDQAPARHIRKLVMQLRNVQYAKVTAKNCEAWEDAGKIEDGRLVRLVRDPRR